MKTSSISSTSRYHRVQIFIIGAVVAFCSIVYELILAQCLTATLGNTVLRYTFTIGLYLFALGLGAFSICFLKIKQGLKFLFCTEIILSITGVLLPILVFGGDYFIRLLVPNQDIGKVIVWCYLHFLVLFIGILSGFELPLLLDIISGHDNNKEVFILLGIDYVFTFLGAVIFPFFVYGYLGIVEGFCFVSILNTLAACFLLSYAQIRNNTYSFILILIFSLNALFYIFSEDVTDMLTFFLVSG